MMASKDECAAPPSNTGTPPLAVAHEGEWRMQEEEEEEEEEEEDRQRLIRGRPGPLTHFPTKTNRNPAHNLRKLRSCGEG